MDKKTGIDTVVAELISQYNYKNDLLLHAHVYVGDYVNNLTIELRHLSACICEASNYLNHA